MTVVRYNQSSAWGKFIALESHIKNKKSQAEGKSSTRK